MLNKSNKEYLELKIAVKKTDWLIRDMFMLLTLPISPVIQFEDVYHVQCSVSFNQRAVTKGNIYLGQKVFEDKTCNFHWIDYNLALRVWFSN